MVKFLASLKESFSELLFPKFCFGCRREGEYLCQDCKSILEISGLHQSYSTQSLKDLYFSADYGNPLIKKLIHKFKYKPFIKELAKSLSSLIIEHFQLLDNKPDFFSPFRSHTFSHWADFILIPIPLGRKRLKWRGFNQAQEIGKELSNFLSIPLVSDCLIKIRETPPQVELSDEERRENIKNVFLVRDKELIKQKRVLLVDDVYTTGSTMEEAAEVLKENGAKEITGIVVARG
jgi:ComF family protein